MFANKSTEQLRILHANLDKYSMMAAGQMGFVPEELASELGSTSAELERREAAYRKGCETVKIDDLAAEWLDVIGLQTLDRVLERFGQGSEKDDREQIWRVNPKNPAYLEISLVTVPDGQEDEKNWSVLRANFILRYELKLPDVKALFPDLSANASKQGVPPPLVLRLANDRPLRIEFITNQEETTLVKNIVVWSL